MEIVTVKMNPLDEEIDFVQRCRHRRLAMGMSQRELSSAMDTLGLPMHQSSVAKFESTGTDRRPLRLGEALALSHILSVPLGPSFEEANLLRQKQIVDDQIRALERASRELNDALAAVQS